MSHDQNLVEARKIANPNISLAVIKELNNRLNEAEINRVDLENISKYAEMVKVSDDNLNFIGPKLSDTNARNMFGKVEKLDYFFYSKLKSDKFSIGKNFYLKHLFRLKRKAVN